MNEYVHFNYFMACAGTVVIVGLLLLLAIIVLRWLCASVFPLSGSGGDGRYSGYYDDLPPVGTPTSTSAPVAPAAPAPRPSPLRRPRSMMRPGSTRPPANAGWEEGRQSWED